jgi:adenine-specific DNA-methyltransferase
VARNTLEGSTPVDSITHDEKRANIPTADNVDFHNSVVLEEVRQVRYARDESLDPQLIWRGKYPSAEEDHGYDNDLVTDAPPIYIQEKIDPRVLIENLRRTAERPEEEPEFTLFDSFDGLDDLQQIEFYEHDANWSNRMILGDSLQVMASLSERERLRGKVQMAYIDPPYGISFGSNWQVSTRNRTVRDGKLEDVAREVEQIRAFRDTWELGIHSYCSYLRDRLFAARDLLAESGTCFVQIGDENVHLVRSLMDEVFGSNNFVSQIAFVTTSGAGSFAGGTNVLANVLNYVIAFAKDIEQIKYRQLFRAKALGGESVSLYTSVRLVDGSTRPLTKEEKAGADLPQGARVFGIGDLTSQTTRVGQTTVFPVTVGDKTVTPAKGGWKTNREGMDRLITAGRVYAGSGKNLGYIRYIDDFPAAPLSNSWTDTSGQGQFGGDKLYVVQTATKVIERCVLMSTDPGDLVIDPTCGSGTSAFVAEQWGRRWITIDSSRVALALTRQRLMSAQYPWYLLADTDEGHRKEQTLNANVLSRPEFGGDIRQGFVCQRIPHIMLKSIANNPDIKEGMTRDQIDAAIKRHADFELLYDKPFADSGKVRVAGPFTVESLSPHRALSFSDWDEPTSEAEAAKDAASPNFEQSILDNLAKAGIQNGTKAERIVFAAFETYAGSYIQAIGEQIESGAHARPSRVGIAVGPQYGTVSATYVKNAAKEAIQVGDLDLLCILGFAFDPNVTNVTEADGVTVEATDDGFAHVEGARLLVSCRS